jgi:hypothetical protein
MWRSAVWLILAFLVGVFAKGSNQVERKISQSRNNCELKKCSHLFSMESMNCVNECMSATCYEQVYGEGKELEDGELNNPLDRQFRTCMRKELTTRGRTQRNREAEKRKSDRETAP